MKLLTVLLGGLAGFFLLLTLWVVWEFLGLRSGEVVSAPIQAIDGHGCYWTYSARFETERRRRVYQVQDREDTFHLGGKYRVGIGHCGATDIRIGSQIEGLVEGEFVERRSPSKVLLALPLLLGVVALIGRGAWLAQYAPHKFPGLQKTPRHLS